MTTKVGSFNANEFAFLAVLFAFLAKVLISSLPETATDD